MKLLSFRRT